jgi:peroxiredoxin Q/BCP
MNPLLSRAACALSLALVPAALSAQGPAVGDAAPDVTLPIATKDGVREAVSLRSLGGKTVVLAFFPKARTSGCTIQMKAYRDQYQRLFGDGKDVVLIAISRDTPEALASWAKDEQFPFWFASDVDGVAGTAYGTLAEGRQWESRVLFVIDPAGKVRTVMRPFREVDPTAYDELQAAVAATR